MALGRRFVGELGIGDNCASEGVYGGWNAFLRMFFEVEDDRIGLVEDKG